MDDRESKFWDVKNLLSINLFTRRKLTEVYNFIEETKIYIINT